eukprot:CAMPEP_0201485626 /NCGR_PEP_ID=MMETSP0151_2-20130828/9719_1 /ASSEMBLY_ACC=CAM_ASM_000257 /TAXON_ID=200890 /ORGANISM="Paramoeba atlantica, Strain 621/1 / CCAP 1560/9" /LENGTH=297 /DNA_ID=CAMNT_0047869847 /DNA_START=555 /DNA_END=1449 /DNA_ORIENTATION=+
MISSFSKLGRITKLPKSALNQSFEGQKILVVGGSRGIGFGVASVLAEIADVTIIVENHQFYQGDIGSVRTSKLLIQKLSEEEDKWDQLIVTAGVFPDWENPRQEDGVDKVFAIDVLGRYFLYREADKFMKKSARFLDVLAPAESYSGDLDREIMSGSKDVTSLFTGITQFCLAAEIMLAGVTEQFQRDRTVISINPGLIKTELHQGQGFLFDLLRPIIYFFMAISLEESGQRIASILASPMVHQEGITYVDNNLNARTRCPALQEMTDKHGSWLMSFLDTLFTSSQADPPQMNSEDF